MKIRLITLLITFLFTIMSPNIFGEIVIIQKSDGTISQFESEDIINLTFDNGIDDTMQFHKVNTSIVNFEIESIEDIEFTEVPMNKIIVNNTIGSVYELETSQLLNITFNETTSIKSNYELAITNYELKQNYPNPFNPVTKIRYTLSVMHNAIVEVVVHNSAGQQVWSSPITDHPLRVTGSILFNGSKFNSGIYYYSLIIDGIKMDTKSMILIK